MIEKGKVIMACSDLGLNYYCTPGIIYIMYQKKTEAFFKGVHGTTLGSHFASGYIIGLVLDEYTTKNKIMYRTLRSIKEFEKDEYNHFSIINFDYNTGLEENIESIWLTLKRNLMNLTCGIKRRKSRI